MIQIHEAYFFKHGGHQQTYFLQLKNDKKLFIRGDLYMRKS